MKIILCGKSDVAVECLQFLIESGDQVWAIANRGDDGRDGWQKSFKRAAAEMGVPCDQPSAINDPEFVQRLKEFRSDLFVSVQYEQILHDPLLDAVGCPCLNLHFALLPRNRGVAPIAWAVADGDEETGATLHHMVRAVDAGDIVAQAAIPIGPVDTARDVYDNVSKLAIHLFQECYPLSPEMLAARRPQDLSAGTLHRSGEFDFSKKRIDWGRPAQELQRWIRAMIFPPFQYPELHLNGRVLAVSSVGSEIEPAADVLPGTVVSEPESGGFQIAAQDGVIYLAGVCEPAATSDGVKIS